MDHHSLLRLPRALLLTMVAAGCSAQAADAPAEPPVLVNEPTDVVPEEPTDKGDPDPIPEPVTTPTEPVSEPGDPTEPAPKPSAFSLRMKKDFSVSSLEPETALWYKRFYAALTSATPRRDYAAAAASGDLFQLGRTLNPGMGDVMAALRITGDPRLVEVLDSWMQTARAGLKDFNGDGFLNWRYLHKAEGAEMWYGDDLHVMDDMLTHAGVAAAAHVFAENCAIEAKYCERATFWKTYLKGHFEAKWRKRNKVPTGARFIDKNLTHPHLHWTRYHYYLAKLTGDASYLAEAKSRAAEFAKICHSVSTPAGTAYVFGHSVPEPDDKGYCHPTIYGALSVRAIVDLSLEGFAQFGDDAVMARFARMYAQIMLNNGAKSVARDVCGEKSWTVSGKTIVSDPRTGALGIEAKPLETAEMLNLSYSSLAAWDKSGKIGTISKQVYETIETKPEAPRSIPMPLAFMLRAAKK